MIIDKLYVKIISIIIELVDYSNKKKIKFIYFEHHYDLMINKLYIKIISIIIELIDYSNKKKL